MTDAQIAIWRENQGKRLLQRVGVTAGKVVLDFGCREGNYTLTAAPIVGPTGRVYALDKRSEVLDELMAVVKRNGYDNVVRVDTSGEMPLPLPDGSVDVALIYDVLHLIGWMEESGKTTRRSTATDRRGFFRELLRVLRPGGVLSAYCTHLTTHTDVQTAQDIAAELKGERFDSRDAFDADMIHDSQAVVGGVMNFIKPAGVKAQTGAIRPRVAG